jgi:septal ring factor EnvC (AmiA/AmiB activator)
MTIDERIEKLEHVTAAHIEQARKDYEENRRLQRELQSHIEAIWQGMERRDQEYKQDMAERDRVYKQEQKERDQITDRRFRETDERIDKLVSAIGRLIERLPIPPNGKA